MGDILLLPFAQYWWAYIGFIVALLAVLAFDLGVILVFVGLKMVWLNEAFGGKFPISWSLGIIGAILAVSIIVSIAWNRARGGSEDSGEGGGSTA